MGLKVSELQGLGLFVTSFFRLGALGFVGLAFPGLRLQSFRAFSFHLAIGRRDTPNNFGALPCGVP